MDWFVTVVKRYVQFRGRAGRPEYWWFTLIYIVIWVFLHLLDGITGTALASGEAGLLSGLFALALFLPALGVTVRRLHDTDRSGWWILLAFIPVLGAIALFVFMVLKGTAGANRFGAGPEPAA